MDMVLDLLSFSARSFVIFLTVVASTAAVVMLVRRAGAGRSSPRGWLEVRPLNERFFALKAGLEAGMARGKSRKALKKQHQAEEKALEQPAERPTVYVLDFDGDVFASATASLRDEVTAIVGVARPKDEVVIRLESSGGAVPHYGLAASQLARLKEKGLTVTVCIDRVAASGGYMMACVADRVVAAPFSLIGSIGVVAQVPNVRRFLKRHEVDVEEFTAGEFKRTLSLFGEVTDKGKAKLQEQLDETHVAFKTFVKQHRAALDIDRVATGEVWLGTRARELGLVDQVTTSDALLLERAQTANLFLVHYHPATGWRQRVLNGVGSTLERLVFSILGNLEQPLAVPRR